MSNCASRSSRRAASLVIGLAITTAAFMQRGAFSSVGIRDALACSGAGPGGTQPPQPGVTSFGVPTPEGSTELGIANDGFFVIEVAGFFTVPADQLTAISVQVSDAVGAAVSGSLHRFPSRPGLFWLADAPLVDGAYTAMVSAPAKPSLPAVTVKLTALGAPTPLALGTVEPTEWFEYHRFTGGTQVTCQTGNGSPCGAALTFGEVEETTPAVDLRVTAPPINGQVAWQASLHREDGELMLDWPPQGPILRAGDKVGGRLEYAKKLPEYCVTLKMVDQRTDQALTSPPLCWKSGKATAIDAAGGLASCIEPPSPALFAPWCRAHPSHPRCNDVVIPGTAGAANTGEGVSGAGNTSNAGSAGAIFDSGDPPAHPVDQGPRDDGSSSACAVVRVGAAPSAAGSATALLLGLAGISALRRRKLRNRESV